MKFNIPFNEDEIEYLQEISKEKKLSKEGILIQALRVYHLYVEQILIVDPEFKNSLPRGCGGID